MEEGKVLRDGAIPLASNELTGMEAKEGFTPRVFLNFILPVIAVNSRGGLHSSEKCGSISSRARLVTAAGAACSM